MAIPILRDVTIPTAVVRAKVILSTSTSITLDATHESGLLIVTNASPIAITFPLFSSVPYKLGAVIDFVQGGAGKITFAGAGGVTLRPYDSQTRTVGLNAVATAINIALNEWLLTGMLEEP